MTEHSGVSVSEEERLDDSTEKAMLELIQAGLTHGYTTKLAIADCRICQEALIGARRSVRTLIEEARKENRLGDGRMEGPHDRF